LQHITDYIFSVFIKAVFSNEVLPK